MTLKAAFIFLAPSANSTEHRSTVRTPEVDLTVVGVPNYVQAESIAKLLLEEGVTAIELCGGFGVSGTACIAAAVNGKAAVGAVRFDSHPGLGGKSGDQVFSGH
jgi:Family of unknown function (DUF6506)